MTPPTPQYESHPLAGPWARKLQVGIIVELCGKARGRQEQEKSIFVSVELAGAVAKARWPIARALQLGHSPAAAGQQSDAL